MSEEWPPTGRAPSCEEVEALNEQWQRDNPHHTVGMAISLFLGGCLLLVVVLAIALIIFQP